MAWSGARLAVFAWGLVSSALAMPAATAAQPYLGQWQVRQVLVHEDRADRLPYQVNDPRLVGRTVDIGARQIESDLPEASHCAHPVFAPSQQGLNTLLLQTMASALPGQDVTGAFGLQIPSGQQVPLAWATCTAGQFGPSLQAPAANKAGSPERTWVALLARKQLLTPWYGDTLLVLQPWVPGQRASPSFDCSQSRWPAEKAICASPRLASYDLSVSRAWRAEVQACEGEAACLKDSQRRQKQWLATRNRCSDEEACLREAMKARLDVLMTPTED